MDGHPEIRVTRRELYERVWAEPVSRVCKTYGLSDVGLAKICTAWDIPRPPRGYWARLQSGQPVKATKLKPHPKGDPVVLTYHPQPEPPPPDPNRPPAGRPERVVVADRLSDPHPLVERTVRGLTGAKPGAGGRVRPKLSGCLDVEVSPPQADRACRLLDALVKALAANGAEVKVGEEERPKTWVAVGDDRVSVRLEEELDREEAVESFFAHRHAVAHVPSGRFVLLVDDALGWGFRRRWADGKTPLEGRLHTAVAGVLAAVEATRTTREANARREREREEQERRRRQAEDRRRRERARADDFDGKLAAWERAGRIRAFVAAARAAAVLRDGAVPPGGELDRWLAWALRRADRLDPLTTERPERRWPPPAGHRAKPTESPHGWWADGVSGTPVEPPGEGDKGEAGE